MDGRRIVLVVMLTTVATTADRTILPLEVNPDCEGNCSEPWLIHVAANGQNDTLHHLWGAHGALSFMVVKTSLDAVMKVNWTELQTPSNVSVSFSEIPIHVFGLSIPNLILFNDTDNSGRFNNSTKEQIIVPMTDFTWEVKTASNSTHEAGIIIETNTFRGELLPNETKISVQVAAFGENGRSTLLPHLLRTPDSAQFDLVLDHLVLDLNSTDYEPSRKDKATQGISGFINARWALDLVMFCSEEKEVDDSGFKLSTKKSLDDENTPGVFHLDEIMTTLARKSKNGGYMQWRPVSYLSSSRDINLATNPNIDVNFTPLKEISQPLKESLAYAVFGNELVGTRMTAKTNVAFGMTNDNFYSENNYTTWTVAIGNGYPPNESFSTMVIIVITLGLSIPALMFIIGGTIIACRKFRRSSQPLIEN
ncbi:glycosylated lysosomal membrane protein B [Procambarus clarkii]|uniref:glycosylated lysosomal membrane protein B n=1 Tax=Procambarus clarkii TaxID=6728 RepID=UPI0037432474